MYRQGDVLVVPLDPGELPATLIHAPRDRRNQILLALGPSFAHAIE